MPNWASTAYAIEGDPEILQKIKEAIQAPMVEEGSSENWEGNVLNTLGLKWDRKTSHMRGFIDQSNVEINHNVLKFYAEEAWETTDFRKVLCTLSDDIVIFYVTEECGLEVYVTNDEEGQYFPERYFVDTCVKGSYQSEYFIYEESVWQWLEEITEGEVKSEQDVELFNKAAKDSDDFISVHEFVIGA